MNAIVYGDIDEVRARLQVDDLLARDFWSRTEWLLAICVGDVQKADVLLKAGANLQDRGRCDESSLQCAILSRNLNMMQYLLDLGIEVDIRDDFGRTALMHAVESDNVDLVCTLLRHGADIEALNNIGDKPISFVHSAKVAKVLVDAGADINYVNSCGDWPLKTAVDQQQHELVLELLAMGALPDITSTGATALYGAVGNDELQTMEALIAAGASLKVQTVDGCGLLCYARSAESIKLLLAAGIDIDLEDQDGKKAYEYFDDPELRASITPN